MMNSEASHPGVSVLIVEDDWQVSTAVQRQLARAGYHTLEPADDGLQAVHRAAREHPDLLIVDIALAGELDGLMVADRIRRTPPFPPVIFLTGRSDDASLARAIQIGAVGYLLKPFQPAQLLTTVRLGVALGRAERRQRRAQVRDDSDPKGRWPGVERPSATGPSSFALQRLTPREREVVRYLSAHYRPRDIAQTLDISYHTVRNHLKQIFRKLGVSSQLELIVTTGLPADREMLLPPTGTPD